MARQQQAISVKVEKTFLNIGQSTTALSNGLQSLAGTPTMPRLSVFESISLDGYFTDAQGDMSWAHAGSDDAEFGQFVAGNARGGGALLFGRITYEMMASFWPT